MNHISNIGDSVRPDRVPPGAASKPASGAEGGERRDIERADHAEISDLGQLLSAASDLPDVRAEKVAAIRTLIEQDVESFVKERLDGTVDRLFADLQGG